MLFYTCIYSQILCNVSTVGPIVMFIADDTTISCNPIQLIRIINIELDKLIEWFAVNN